MTRPMWLTGDLNPKFKPSLPRSTALMLTPGPPPGLAFPHSATNPLVPGLTGQQEHWKGYPAKVERPLEGELNLGVLVLPPGFSSKNSHRYERTEA